MRTSRIAMQETQVQSLGREDPLEKGMATHSIILAWRIPWTEEPGTAAREGTDLKETCAHLGDSRVASEDLVCPGVLSKCS